MRLDARSEMFVMRLEKLMPCPGFEGARFTLTERMCWLSGMGKESTSTKRGSVVADQGTNHHTIEEEKMLLI